MIRYTKILLLLLLFQSLKISAQIKDTSQIHRDSIITPKQDTIYTLPDSLFSKKSTIKDTSKKHNQAIKNPIKFTAKDSMYISVKDKQIILFGKGQLTTEGMKLDADSIGIDMDKKEIQAKGMKDSLGKIEGSPKFTSDGQDYTASRMKYRFDTKKGLVYNVMTQEQDGFLHGEIVKIHSDNEMHILQGKYTTCDLPHPHYYIDLTKAKLIKNKRIITGPIYFVIQDIPLPLWAPFGIFPLSRKNSSGIHLPTYADELDRGFGLVGAGYYWVINDYVDLDITGDVYTKGSWGINLRSNFNKRYLFSSSINLKYFHYQNGEKILKTTKISNSYSIQANFNQAQKAWPNSHFSGSINYVCGNIQQYNAKNIEQFVNTNANSSLSFQKTFAGTPFRMSLNANLSQNLRDSIDNISFPNLTFTMNRIFPFKPRKKPAKGKWYEKISIQLNSSLQNSLNAHDTLIRKHFDIASKMMKSGLRYDIPVQTTMTIFKYFHLSPSFNFHGKIYPFKIIKNKITTTDTSRIENDTIWGLNHVYDFDFRTGLNTRIYGLFNLNIGRLKAIRHTINANISYTYKPDFSEPKWGYYLPDPQDSTKTYSPYAGSLFGVPSKGEQQVLSFSMSNNFEAKIISGKDTTRKEKKIKLLDNLNISESYNFAKDSLNLSNLNMNASMSPIKNTNVSLSASFDPYSIDKNGQRINKLEIVENKRLARLTSSTITFGTRFSSDELNNILNPKQEKNKNENKNENKNDKQLSWSASLNYSFRFSKRFNTNTQKFDINLSQNASLNLNIIPTPLWKVSVRTGYDFDAEKVTSTTFSFYRDLHCWEMSLQVTPFGRMKSYMFQINIKSPMFEAIKYKRERSWHDNNL